MTAYYNEIDPYCVQWLRNLIDAKLVAPGVVDDRPIQDVRPVDLASFTQCHFFAGLGGWSAALRLADISDNRPLWTGSCPCQPFSAAGQRRGFADERHLWPYWQYLIAQRRPAAILGEQVASASQWLRLVRSDLEALGYAVGCLPIEAASAGADHLRDRFWFVAHGAQQSERESQHQNGAIARGDAWPDPSGSLCFDVGDGDGQGSQGQFLHTQRPDQRTFGSTGVEFLSNTERERVRGTGPTEALGATRRVQGADAERQWFRPDARPVRDTGEYQWVLGADGKARRVKPGICLLAHGVPARVAKLRAFGNAIDPRPAAAFIKAALT